MLGFRTISRFLNPQDPERDLKLAAFGSVTVAAVYWLTREQARGPITTQWVDAFKWLLIAVSLGGGAWAAVDKWRPSGAAPDNAPGGSNDLARLP